MSYWVNESVFYHIYPIGFCGAPRVNDGETVCRLDKVIDWIPHLKSMSVNAIYFGPVFKSTVHGYDTDDYRVIDNRLGTNESFKHICDELHKNGIKVVLDGVFNHVGRNFWAFKDVCEKGNSSQYCGWFQNLNFGGKSPYGDSFSYEGWHGYYDLVKLNLKNPDVKNYLLDSVGMWMDEFKIDGLRLDAADCVDPDFFKALRHYTKSKDSNFWLMGEIIHGDYNRWANPEMLDSVTNYECYKGIYSSHNDKNYFEIAHSLNRQFANGGIYRSIYTYNFVDIDIISGRYGIRCFDIDCDQLQTQFIHSFKERNLYTCLTNNNLFSKTGNNISGIRRCFFVTGHNDNKYENDYYCCNDWSNHSVTLLWFSFLLIHQPL